MSYKFRHLPAWDVHYNNYALNNNNNIALINSIIMQIRAAIRRSLPDMQKALENGANPDIVTNLLVRTIKFLSCMAPWEHAIINIINFIAYYY